jgi:hypothetical protein
MASPGIIRRTSAVDVSIHAVVPVSVTTVAAAWAGPCRNNDAADTKSIAVEILLRMNRLNEI